MALIVNGVPQISGAGEIVNNQPIVNVPWPTKVGELQVQDGRLVQDIRLTNPGVSK